MLYYFLSLFLAYLLSSLHRPSSPSETCPCQDVLRGALTADRGREGEGRRKGKKGKKEDDGLQERSELDGKEGKKRGRKVDSAQGNRGRRSEVEGRKAGGKEGGQHDTRKEGRARRGSSESGAEGGEGEV